MLLEISKHPIISKYVCELYCDDTRVGTELLDPARWKSSEYAQHVPAPSYMKKSRDSNGAYARYKQVCEQQAVIKGRREYLASLCLILSRLPKLKSIMVTDNCHQGQRSYDGPKSTASEILEWLGEHPMPKIWPARACSSTTDLWDQGGSPYYAFVTAITALSVMGVPLDTLRVEGSHEGISHRLFKPSRSCDHLGNVLTTVKHLQIHISTHQEEPFWSNETSKNGWIGQVLAEAV